MTNSNVTNTNNVKITDGDGPFLAEQEADAVESPFPEEDLLVSPLVSAQSSPPLIHTGVLHQAQYLPVANLSHSSLLQSEFSTTGRAGNFIFFYHSHTA